MAAIGQGLTQLGIRKVVILGCSVFEIPGSELMAAVGQGQAGWHTCVSDRLGFWALGKSDSLMQLHAIEDNSPAWPITSPAAKQSEPH